MNASKASAFLGNWSPTKTQLLTNSRARSAMLLASDSTKHARNPAVGLQKSSGPTHHQWSQQFIIGLRTIFLKEGQTKKKQVATGMTKCLITQQSTSHSSEKQLVTLLPVIHVFTNMIMKNKCTQILYPLQMLTSHISTATAQIFEVMQPVQSSGQPMLQLKFVKCFWNVRPHVKVKYDPKNHLKCISWLCSFPVSHDSAVDPIRDGDDGDSPSHSLRHHPCHPPACHQSAPWPSKSRLFGPCQQKPRELLRFKSAGWITQLVYGIQLPSCQIFPGGRKSQGQGRIFVPSQASKPFSGRNFINHHLDDSITWYPKLPGH